jgi:hypothetical protein
MRSLLAGLALILCCLPVLAQDPNQNQDPAEAGYQAQWLIGPAYKLDGWAFGYHPLESHDQLVGFQLFHRMESFFGTGASLFFAPGDSAFEVDLDARWIWSLPWFEPYAGIQLTYLTRSNGGIALSLRPGLLAQLPGLPLQLDVYGLASYDVVNALFGTQNPNQLLLGAGAVLQYRL